jgi:hypothetical protein
MQLLEMHGRLAYTALIYSLILTVWGFFQVLRKKKLDGSYWSAVLVGETFILIQLVLGIIIAINGLEGLRDPVSHILFGTMTVLTLPVVFFITRNKADRRSMLYYAIGFLFLVGAIMSGISSAG